MKNRFRYLRQLSRKANEEKFSFTGLSEKIRGHPGEDFRYSIFKAVDISFQIGIRKKKWKAVYHQHKDNDWEAEIRELIGVLLRMKSIKDLKLDLEEHQLEQKEGRKSALWQRGEQEKWQNRTLPESVQNIT